MKIRDGFVTNSSSTNFIIISKDELTTEYLYKKLGFKENSPLRGIGMQLCEDILSGNGLSHYDFEKLNYDNVKEVFGEDTAKKYQKLVKENYHVYAGHTNDDDSILTGFFTCDSFEINEKDFYLNGKDCEY